MYDRDLAAFHDAYAGDLARAGGETLAEALRRAGWQDGMVADVGCGSGITAQVLGHAGYTVTGIEPSPSMRALARKRAPKARLTPGTVADLELPEGLVGIAALGEILSFDLQADLDEVLEHFHAALRPGGVLLLDIAGPDRHLGQLTHVNEQNGALLVMRMRTERLRLIREITLFTRAGRGSWRRSDETHELRLHLAEDVRTGLSRAGFVAVRSLPRYGEAGPTFGEHRPAFIAARP